MGCRWNRRSRVHRRDCPVRRAAALTITTIATSCLTTLAATGRTWPHTIAGSRPHRDRAVATAGTAINNPLLGCPPVAIQLVRSDWAGRNRINRLVFPVNIGRVPFLLLFFTREEQSCTPRLPVPNNTSRLGIIRLELAKRVEAIVLNRLDQLLSLAFRVAT